MQRTVLIIGAGLSGLVAAEGLQKDGWNVKILESKDRLGGRIQTDSVDGYLLDHGFQVFLTAYQQASRTLDCNQLELGSFESGAMIRYAGGFHRVADPWRSPKHLIATAISPIGSLLDKLRIARFRSRVVRSNDAKLLKDSQFSAVESLRNQGFSERIIDRFFRPFFGGIFLEPNLETDSGRMDFVFRNFSLGTAALPKDGMQAIPEQLACRLLPGTILFNKTVASITAAEPQDDKSFNTSRPSLSLSNQEHLEADAIVVATEQHAASRLLGLPAPPPACSTICVYFAVDNPPINEATLVLNGESTGPINNLCFPSFAQPSYAPAGKHLLSVSIRGMSDSPPEDILHATLVQLREWFGDKVDRWQFLRTYRVQHALPSQKRAHLNVFGNGTSGENSYTMIKKGVYLCGDYCETASIEGAIRSGMAVAAAVRVGRNVAGA